MENETKSKSSIAFMVELFLMFGILLLVIVVITQALMLTREQSLRARHLTGAVIAAESAAEAASGCGSPEEAAELISKIENAEDVKADAGTVTYSVSYKDKDGTESRYKVSLDMDIEEKATGSYTESTINVSLDGEDEALYTLRIGNYEKETPEGEESSKTRSAAGSGKEAEE